MDFKKLFTSLDKITHILAGFSIVLAMSYALKDPVLGSLFGLLAAAEKEHYDQAVRDKDPDLWDFIMTVTGSIMGLAWYLLF